MLFGSWIFWWRKCLQASAHIYIPNKCKVLIFLIFCGVKIKLHKRTFVLYYLFATHPYRALAAPSNNLPITLRLSSMSHSPDALRWPYKAYLRWPFVHPPRNTLRQPRGHRSLTLRSLGLPSEYPPAVGRSVSDDSSSALRPTLPDSHSDAPFYPTTTLRYAWVGLG